MKILSFDVGGSKTSYALVSLTGRLLTQVTTVETPKELEQVKALFQRAVTEFECDGLAVATAGVVLHNKVQFKPRNLPSGYEELDFSRLIPKPVIVENDANAAAWAEYKTGVLKDTTDSIMLTLGTGVGCGIISNGRLLHGKSGAAGEVLFPLAGKDLAELAAKNGIKETDCFAIEKLVKQGNKNAIAAYEEWQKQLVNALVLLNNLFDTEAVALSGSLSGLVDYAKAEAAVNEQSPHNPLRVCEAYHKNDAGLIGAALLLKEMLYD